MELPHRLIEEVRKGGQYLYGLALRKNRGMLRLLRDLYLPERERREDGVARFEVGRQAQEH
jgi:hypothetical protein